MSHITFKEFNQFLSESEKSDTEFADYLEEGFFSDLFASKESKDQKRVENYKHLLAHTDPKVRREAERGLNLMVQKGNLQAKALAASAEKAQRAKKTLDKAKWDLARAEVEAGEQGESSAWRREAGSIKRAPINRARA